jgi:hypothetical protein
MLFVLRLEDDSDAARRSPCEGGLAIHTSLLDLSLGHDHGDVSDHHHRSERGEHRIHLPYDVRSNLTPTQKLARQAAGQINNRNLHERKTKEI